MSKRAEMRRRARDKRSDSSSMYYLFIGGLALLVLAIVVVVAVTRTPGGATTASTSSQSGQNIPFPEVPRISIAEAATRLGQPNVVFLDTRSVQEHKESHITGSVNIPLPETAQRVTELPPTAEIISYCT
jgi:hypothetical protein